MSTRAGDHGLPAGKLQPVAVAIALKAEGRLSEQSYTQVVSLAASIGESDSHALEVIASLSLSDEQHSGKIFDLKHLLEWLSEKTELPIQRIDPLKVDVARVTEIMSYTYAARHGILALEVTPEKVVFATCEPLHREWEGELERLTSRQCDRVLMDPVELARYAVEFYSMSRSVQKAEQQQRKAQQPSALQNLEQLTQLGRKGNLDANDQHVVSIVDWVLQYAFEQRASDIHLEPRRDMSIVRFRIDGMLHQVYEMPPTVMTAVVSRLKTLSRLDVAEKRRPQDGRLKTRNPDGTEVELRLSTMPIALGEKMVMRIFDPQALYKDLMAESLDAKERLQWLELIRSANGIVLVTGPTGSGKTTTLYSTLKALAKPELNVCTVEDPIELVEPLFNQCQVQPAIQMGFAEGIRTLLRQDPDIIMVGEIRDQETAQMAVQAALTGHLVFSTLHTNDAPSAITRLRDLGVPSYLLNATLRGVIGQRLVRKLCPHCRADKALDETIWQVAIAPWKASLPKVASEAAGCEHCRQTGFLGRLGLYELMPIGPALQTLINQEASLAQLQRGAVKAGMRQLRLNGVRAVLAKQTSLSEIIRVTPKLLGQ